MGVVNPHQVTKDFERALCEYTGAPFAVAVNSCTMALLLAIRYCFIEKLSLAGVDKPLVILPKKTYVSVPMSVIHAGGQVAFRDLEWHGSYELHPYPVWDSARHFTSGMYVAGRLVCASFHWTKTLGIQQGGAILHDNYEADQWLRRARFDGRTEGVPPSMDKFTQIGWHCYMSPEVAAEGLVRLSFLPKHNAPLPNDDYPDLSLHEAFK